MNSFPVSVAAADRVGYQGLAVACTVSTTSGRRTFEARHEPFAALLVPGTVTVRDENGSRHTVATDGGLVLFDGRQCEIVTLSLRVLDKS